MIGRLLPKPDRERKHSPMKEGRSFYIYSHSGYLNYENQVAWLYDLLTVMIASIGATNAQITPLSVDNQQLEATNGTLVRSILMIAMVTNFKCKLQVIFSHSHVALCEPDNE